MEKRLTEEIGVLKEKYRLIGIFLFGLVSGEVSLIYSVLFDKIARSDILLAMLLIVGAIYGVAIYNVKRYR